MSKRLKLKPALIYLIFCLLTAILIFVKIDTGKKVDKNALVKKDLVIPAIDSPVANSDLYYLKHPYLLKGDQLNDEGRYDSAIYYYNQASLKFENEHQWENYVWVNSYIGRLYLYVAGQNFEDALPYLQKAFEKGIKTLGSNHPYMGVTCYYFGLYYYDKKWAEKSLEMYNKALAILLNNFRKDNIYTADVYDALGNVYANLMFDNIVAESNYLRSIRIKEALPGEEKKSGLTPGYYNLVSLNILIGDFEKAQSYCYEAIRNAQYVKYHKFYWLELLEGVLAGIYHKQQLFEKAINKLNSAIRINYEHHGDKSYLPFYYTLLGDIYSGSSIYDTAIIFYEKALKLKNAHTLFDYQQKQAAVTNYSLGTTYLKLKNYKAALFYISKCLDMRLEVFGKNHGETAIAFQGIGSVYMEKGFTDSALKYFQSGLRACTKNFNDTTIYTVPAALAVNNSFHSYKIIRDKASLLKQLYFRNASDTRLLLSSLDYYCLADTLMTLFRSEYARETAKLDFSRENYSIYEEAIDCATLIYQKTNDRKFLNLVFNFMDRRKSGLLLEALNEKEILAQAGIPSKEQHSLFSLQKELAFLQSQLGKVNNEENPEESVLQVLHSRISNIESKYDSLHEKLINNYPFYANTQNKKDTVSLKDIQVSSGLTNSFILEYFWGEKAVYVMGIYGDSVQLQKISRTPEMDNFLDTLQADLLKGYVFSTRQNDFSSFQKSAYFTYNALVKPILNSFNFPAKDKDDKPAMTVIPDGPLYYIPFEVLITSPGVIEEIDYRKLNYLVNIFEISYDYSTRFMLKNYNRRNISPNPEVLALGFSKDLALKSTKGKLNMLEKYDNAELPGSASEIKSISAYMRGQFYLGDDATEYIFKKESPNYDILHLAVHGESDSLNSYNSKLIFKKGNDSLNDGNLYAYEIYNLPIKAKLAVLSACESGIGKLNQGEGMFNIARGFIYAGCPSVIISYWRVGDNSTDLIISDFYKQISGGNKIHQSLRKAKLDYLNKADRRNSHPANWAAFVAVGNMTALAKESMILKPIHFIIITILLGMIVFFIAKTYVYYRRDNKN